MKKSLTKISILFSIFAPFFLGAFTFADTGTAFTGTVAQVLTQKKTEVNALFDTTYNKVYDYFQKSGLNLMKSLNYKSLVCLGVMSSDNSILLELQKDKEQIKVWFLRDFLQLESDNATLEEKARVLKDNNISLFDQGTTYETEKTRILNKILDTTNIHKWLIRNFETNYTSKIAKFGQDIIAYSLQNSGIVGYINDKIYTLESISTKFDMLTSEIERVNSLLLWSGSSLLWNMGGVRNSFIASLESSLQAVIARYVKNYKILPTLSGVLTSEKDYTLRLYGLDFDEKLSTIFAQWYDKKNYDLIKNKITALHNKYMNSNDLMCTNIFQDTADFDRSIKSITDLLYPMVANIGSGSTLAQTSGSTAKIKADLLTQFTSFNNTNLKKYLRDFQTLINNKVDVLLTQQKAGTTNISSTIIPSITIFTRPFHKGEKSTAIQTLQTLLKNNGYYLGDINSIFTKQTIEAIYKFQLQNGLLIGYEKRPQSRWWMGPATRAKLNALIMNGGMEESVQNEEITTTTQTPTPSTWQALQTWWLSTTNIYQTMINQLIGSTTVTGDVKNILQQAFLKTTTSIDTSTDATQKIFLQEFKAAIQAYLNTLQ